MKDERGRDTVAIHAEWSPIKATPCNFLSLQDSRVQFTDREKLCFSLVTLLSRSLYFAFSYSFHFLSPAFCLSLFLQSLAYSRIFRPFVRASNKYPVTARNSSVHAGLIQLALLQHRRVYGGGKFTGVSRFSFAWFSCSFHLSPALENTRPCDRHAAVEEFFFFFFFLNLVHPIETFSLRNFFHPVGKHSKAGNSNELPGRERSTPLHGRRRTIVEFRVQLRWLIVDAPGDFKPSLPRKVLDRFGTKM